ncbi:hypothetical protein C349_07213 [Cryptococcus neoformans var. grubii Br795]|nr:hypothetical protein C362_07069 [Cryptococcus neoformans var. grubii Bt1]OWZ49495.1 hypothetical protein C368_07092 [Cryptococcus neoformans var. grubii 125.91]OXG09750.1 hypothetical protein C366_07008 [Cryptococcus neoformans var. grubii Tu401-1]OXG25527.1 hypothetical protein C360_07065 [Cryptococcus neoformans var. grubii Bt15]OXG39099.1 hypothetical protein C355_07090 [Cryptococcus neoformans var. grubii Th84]OXG71375.1 hypothetical protein C349_07213 [Cryptococcus neoformans var. grub
MVGIPFNTLCILVGMILSDAWMMKHKQGASSLLLKYALSGTIDSSFWYSLWS